MQHIQKKYQTMLHLDTNHKNSSHLLLYRNASDDDIIDPDIWSNAFNQFGFMRENSHRDFSSICSSLWQDRVDLRQRAVWNRHWVADCREFSAFDEL